MPASKVSGVRLGPAMCNPSMSSRMGSNTTWAVLIATASSP